MVVPLSSRCIITGVSGPLFGYYMSQRDDYDEGFSDGYEAASKEHEVLAQENEAMRQLIGANYRGMKEEIRKELATDTNTN